MPTKTDRILGLLPGTFRAAAGVSALHAVADAFGRELQGAENSLAALMRAHWVDHADFGADEVDDLNRIGALYGLAARPDEGVEEFREHLKRYVRTFLEGTVTVQGILRVTAEALGLTIEDTYEELDTWWRRDAEVLTTFEARGDDAAENLFGVASANVRGDGARPAQVVGTVDLSAGVDLRRSSILRLEVDGNAPVDVDLVAGAGDPERVSLDEVAAAVAAQSQARAHHDGSYLTLASPVAGASSRLEVLGGPGDAAGAVLGLASRFHSGSDAEVARVTGSVDLSGGSDLSDERYLRVVIDGTHRAEIDCAGPDPSQTTLDQIRDAVNDALGIPAASHDGRFLALESPKTGFDSSVAFEEPAAQDARGRLFGDVSTIHLGRGAQAARLVSPHDLRGGVDLSGGSRVWLGIDDGPLLTVDVAGPEPANTLPREIASALNEALGYEAVRLERRFLTLTSSTTGADSRILFEKLPADDASDVVFGIGERSFLGSDAIAARLVGSVDLTEGADLRSRRLLWLGVDGGEPSTIDLNPDCLFEFSLGEVVAALNDALGAEIATSEGDNLVLTSPTVGELSRIVLGPFERVRRRRFVTRAVLRDEAARELLGFVARRAEGTAATQAVIDGRADLSRGIDLSESRFLRLAVDGAPAEEIDCAGPRPRATTLDEVIERINDAFGQTLASSDGRQLRLSSPTTGAGSRLALEPPRATDALDLLLGVAPGLKRGRDATGVRFVATADLGTGIELEEGAAVKLAVDGAAAVEIGFSAGHFTLSWLANELNLGLGGTVATHDGRRLTLASPSEGGASRVDFELPTGLDVTQRLFGIAAPRSYRGRDAAAAQVLGKQPLPAAVDLSVARFLRLGVDGVVSEIDAGSEAEDRAAASPSEIVAGLNTAVGSPVAALEEDRLVITSPTAGFESRVALERSAAGDARFALFGDAATSTRGSDPAPAVLEGEIQLTGAVDLSRRRLLRLRLDGSTLDVDVAGAAPENSVLEEVVAAVNEALPGLASATEDDRLRLVSASTGETSRLEVLPRRYLELQEYPPEPLELVREARHGTLVRLLNSGAADAALEMEVRALRGGYGAGLVDLGRGWEVRVFAVLNAGETLLVRRTPAGEVTAEIREPEGGSEPVPAARIVSSGPESLTLYRGLAQALYRECRVSRFNEARFDSGRFAGGVCTEWGLFDASRFAARAPEIEDHPVIPIFAPSELPTEPTAELGLAWLSHRPGSLRVNLPADLPVRFGGRFNVARFGTLEPELLPGAVTEPEGDPDSLITLVNDGKEGVVEPSRLVEAKGEEEDSAPRLVPRAELGWEPVTMPFREPQLLTLGNDERPARIYLTEEGLDGFIRIDARAPGAWGNEVSVSARAAGPGRYDLTVSYSAAVFENAREAVLGAPLPELADELLLPGPIGILQAKAAGVQAQAARDRTLEPNTCE